MTPFRGEHRPAFSADRSLDIGMWAYQPDNAASAHNRIAYDRNVDRHLLVVHAIVYGYHDVLGGAGPQVLSSMSPL